MEPIISQDYLESLLDQVSTKIQMYRRASSPSHQTYRNRQRQWHDKLETFEERISDLYNPAITYAFLDYAGPIEDYFLVQGILAAVGSLSGQAAALADLNFVPGLEAGAQKLKEACDSFVAQLPEEERVEFIHFFEEPKQDINRSGNYFFLYGYELMFSLLNRSGYGLPTELLEKVRETVQRGA